MTLTARLTVSLIAGAVAFLGNQIYLQNKLQSEWFVIAAVDLVPGRTLSESDLASVELSGDLGRLHQIAIPWDDRATLYGTQALRTLAKGDLVVRQDTSIGYPYPELEKDEVAVAVSTQGMVVVPDFLRVGSSVYVYVTKSEPTANTDSATEEKILGPFRIVAVNQRVTADEGQDSRSNSTTDAVVTFAVKAQPLGKDPDYQGRLLMNAACGKSGWVIRQFLLPKLPRTAP